MKYKFYLILILSFVFSAFLFFYSLTVGPLKISFYHVIEGLFFSSDTIYHRIIFETRLPRTITAFLTGSLLALSGMILQFITKNPLACPSLLGINQGAGFGIVVILALFPFCAIPIYMTFSLLGGVLAAFFIYIITSSIGYSPIRLILAGQAINALFYALTQAILIFLPTRSGVILININGSLSSSSWELLKYHFPVLILCLFLILLNLKKIHILSLGEQVASSLGLNVKKFILFFLIIVVMMCSFSVSMIGPILFFPLIVNHFSKIIVGENPFILAPTVIIFGANFMLISDVLMRLLFHDKEVAIGLFISILGAPILIFSSKLRKKIINV